MAEESLVQRLRNLRDVTVFDGDGYCYSGAPGGYLSALLREAADALERAEKDTARLDWLDSANARLNAHYGTHYKWRLVLNHNVARLMLGDMKVDLHDTDANGLPSCRDAIDEVRLRSLQAQRSET